MQSKYHKERGYNQKPDSYYTAVLIVFAVSGL